MTEKFASRPHHSDSLGTVREEGGIEPSEEFNLFLDDIDFTVNDLVGRVNVFILESFTVGDLTVIVPPATTPKVPASSRENGMVMVSNETGGIVPAFSDGTNWRRVTDRAIIS